MAAAKGKTSEAAPQYQVPEGAIQHTDPFDEAETHDFDDIALLEGTVIEVRDMELTDRRSGEIRECKAAVVETTDGLRIFWESAGTRSFFRKMTEGMGIWVLYEGKRQLDGGRTMRTFQTYEVR